MSKKKVLIIVSAFILLLTAFFIVYFVTKPEIPRVGLYGLSESENALLKGFAENEFEDEVEYVFYQSREEFLNEYPKEPVDLLFSRQLEMDDSLEGLMARIDENLTGALPVTLQRSTEYNSANYILPLELDHIELIWRRGRITPDEHDVITDFDDFENQLKSHVNTNYYPMVVAGSVDRTLLDFISLLSLSIGGVDGYQKLKGLMIAETPFEQLIRETVLGDVFNKINELEGSGILHQEWLKLTEKDLLFYMENDLTSAVIMRLSFHRTVPLESIRKFGSTPFPFITEKKRGIILDYPGVSISEKSSFKETSMSVIRSILSNEGQAIMTGESRLAPASAAAEAIDRQAASVRYWGAVSTNVLRPLSDGGGYAEEIRRYIALD